MEKTHANRCNSQLKFGLAVSIRDHSGVALPATVSTDNADDIGLQFADTTPPPLFSGGEPIQIVYTEDGSTVYCWSAEIAPEPNSTDLELRVLLHGEGVTYSVAEPS